MRPGGDRDQPTDAGQDKSREASAPATPMFTLPSQRRTTMSPWKVLPFMLLIGIVIGLRVCRMMEAEQRDEVRRIELDRER